MREMKEPAMTDWLKLNVGGEMFETSRSTLTSDSNSILSRMFETNRALLYFPPICLSRARLVYILHFEGTVFKMSLHL